MAVIKVVTAKIAILVAWDFMCHMEIIELCLADNLKNKGLCQFILYNYVGV